jgi:uncharacterized protein (DUF433 family)
MAYTPDKMTNMDTAFSRITIDPAICHGKPCVRGLRYPVEMLLELLSSGMTFDEVLRDYEDLEREDLLAVLAYAASSAFLHLDDFRPGEHVVDAAPFASKNEDDINQR